MIKYNAINVTLTKEYAFNMIPSKLRLSKSRFLLLAASIAIPSLPAYSAEDTLGFADDLICATPMIVLPEFLQSAGEEDSDTQGQIALEGDQMDVVSGNTVIMTGNAYATQGKRGVFADKITYNQEDYRATVEGDVVYYTVRGDEVKTQSMDLEVDTFIGTAKDIQMRLVKSVGKEKKVSANFIEDYSPFAPLTNHRVGSDETSENSGLPVGTRISAETVNIEGEDFQRLTNARITRCPQGEDVLITSSEVELDHAEGVGYAKNVTLRFKGVPFLYAPKFSFPLNDERKSGFLAPSIGQDSEAGLIISAPYYFNIASQVDATIRPTIYADRGMQLHGEFRFLNELGDGVLRGEVLPDDDLFSGEDRYAYGFSFDQKYASGWKLGVDLQDVSDTSYLNDFRNDINLTSVSFLPQTVKLNYSDETFYVRAKAIKYESVAPNAVAAPLDRLPQISFGLQEQSFGMFEFEVDAELINFNAPADDRVAGTRFNVTPSISMPYKSLAGYVKPKIALQSINYSLDNVAEGGEDSPSVVAPVFSVDTGLYFERNMTLAGKSMLQTLEPRVMYVYVPEENQDDLPLFDTGNSGVNSFDVLFREERFFGGDRIGDDHHIAVGVTTEIIDDETGAQRLSASIGQIYFLEDRKVGLNSSDETDTAGESDIFADLSVEFTDDVELNSFVRWDQAQNELNFLTVGFDYRANERRFASVDYLKNNVDLEDVRLQLDWPLAPRVQLQLDQRYSLEDEDFRASSIGFVYDGCCWAAGIKATRLLQSDGETRNAFLATLEFDGLGRIQSAQ